MQRSLPVGSARFYGDLFVKPFLMTASRWCEFTVPGSAHAVGMRHAVAGGGSRLAEGHPRGLALTRRSTPPTLPQGLLDGHFRPASLRAKGDSLLRCIQIRGRGVTSVRASARTNFYPCRLCSPGTQCGMRTKCAGKPRLPARPIFRDGHCIVTRSRCGRVDL